MSFSYFHGGMTVAVVGARSDWRRLVAEIEAVRPNHGSALAEVVTAMRHADIGIPPVPGYPQHPECPTPDRCPCECRECKRAWWAAGRPKQTGGASPHA